MPPSNGTLKHITTCRICGQQFTGDPVGVPIIGEPPDVATMRFSMGLMKHLEKKHPENLKGIQVGGQLFMGFLLFGLFQTADPNLQASIEVQRAQLFAVSRKNTIPDEQLAELISHFGINGDMRDKLKTELVRMRDYLTETGEFAPKIRPRPAAAV